ncbi:hypothetical protein ABW45_04570 [Stenotrophomonas maltophilia]|nr:hypothetical protein ABW45_04570 [Stenotrophomonas maltophilia]
MYLPSYSPARYDDFLPRPSVNMHGVETKLSDMSKALEKISENVGKQQLTVQVEASAILPIVSIAQSVSGSEAAKYQLAKSSLLKRLYRIEARSRRKREAKEQAEKEDQESRKLAAKNEFESQPEPKFWQSDERKTLEEIEAKHGVMGWLERYQSSHELILEMEMRRHLRQSVISRRLSKHFSVDHASQIDELFQICQTVPGAVLNVPHDLMRVVAQIAKEKQLEAVA